MGARGETHIQISQAAPAVRATQVSSIDSFTVSFHFILPAQLVHSCLPEPGTVPDPQAGTQKIFTKRMKDESQQIQGDFFFNDQRQG